MRILSILTAASLLLVACSNGGGEIDQTAGGGGTPTAVAEPTPEPTVAPAPPLTDDGDQVEPTTPPVEEATPTPLPAPTAEPTVEPTATPDPASFPLVLDAGSYCYAGGDDINEMYVRMTVLESGEVSGDTRIFISDEENGYFTSAFQRFTGNFNADASITTDVITWIEYDIQESTESWAAFASTLETDVIIVDATPCDLVREAYVDYMLPGTDIGVTADELLDRTIGVDERVSFEPGATSATVADAVVRGEANRYVLETSGGQVMNLAMTSLEDNAIFDVVSDSGIVLAVEVTSAEIFLPHAGDYIILVSGTRGNATYELTINIG
jgi:hypothetical protein